MKFIFVVNNSQDGSVEYVKSKFGNRIKVLALKKNYGYTGGNNKGAKLAKGDIDLSWRCWSIGYKVVCNSNCKVYHLGSKSIKDVAEKTVFILLLLPNKKSFKSSY